MKLGREYTAGVLGTIVVSPKMGRAIALIGIEVVGATDLGFAPMMGFAFN